MKAWFSLVLEKLSPVAVMTILVGTSLITTAAAGSKIYQALKTQNQNPSGFSNQIALVSDQAPLPSGLNGNFQTNSPTTSAPTTKPTAKSVLPTITPWPPTMRPVLPTAFPQPTFPVAQLPLNPAGANPAGLCLVTLFGTTYEVTPLRRSHPGGDIFVCGTDMTTAYQRQHGTGLNRMQAYVYNPNQSSTGTANPTYAPGRNEDQEDRNREEEHEDDDD